MTTVILALQGLLFLMGGVCAVMMVASAFRKNTVQGLLCLFVPLYVVVWAYNHYDHPQRRPILWIMLGAPLAAAALGIVPIFMMMGSSAR